MLKENMKKYLNWQVQISQVFKDWYQTSGSSELPSSANYS